MQPVGTVYRPNGGVPFYHSTKRKAQPQSDFIQARYGFIFRTKILDFYSGIPIQL